MVLRNHDLRTFVELIWIGLMSIVCLSIAVPKANFYPFGEAEGDALVEKGDDTSTSEIHFASPIIFFKNVYSSCYVNTNGMVSFQTEIPNFVNQQIPVGRYPLAAAFYSDVDTRRTGAVYYRESTSAQLLQNLTTLIRDKFADAAEFTARNAFVVTWDNVGYFDSKDDKKNSFQLVLVSSSTATYGILLYADSGVEWLVGDGKNANVPDTPAQAGYQSAGATEYFQLPASGNLQAAAIATMTNIGVPGMFLHRVSGNTVLDPREVTGFSDGGTDDGYEEYDLYDDYKYEYGDDTTEGGGNVVDVVVEEEGADGSQAGGSADDDRVVRPVVDTDLPIDNTVAVVPIEDQDPARNRGGGPQPVVVSAPVCPPVSMHDCRPPHCQLQRDTNQCPVCVCRYVEQTPDASPSIRYPDRSPQGRPQPEAAAPDPRGGHEGETEGRRQPTDPHARHPAPEPEARQLTPVANEGSLLNAPVCSRETASGSSCHENAICAFHADGGCCKCNSGYYGNGKECLPAGDAQRVNGKFSGEINGQQIPETDLHCYVVTSDGRAYLALSQIEPTVGRSLLFLASIGSAMGWQFAKPSGDQAYNGFSLTGGLFNRTANVHISNRWTVTVNQEFSGKDAYKYFKARMFVTGTLPEVPENADVRYADYTEEYKRISPGIVKAYSTQTVTVGREEHRVVVDQTIRYAECPYTRDWEQLPAVQRLDIERSFVKYDDRERIVRFAGMNKIGPSSNQDLGQTEPSNEIPSEHGGRDDRRRPTDSQPVLTDNPAPGPSQPETAGGAGQGVDSNAGVQSQRCNSHEMCSPHGMCAFDRAIRGYRCQCRHGETGDGRNCKSVTPTPRAKECRSHEECSRYGMCKYVESVKGYRCHCRAGYSGDGVQCQASAQTCDVARNCDSNADCVLEQNEQGKQSYKCRCRPGFTGNGLTCQQLDTGTAEVQCNVLNNCHGNAQCQEDPQTRRHQCRCQPGFEGDGYQCRPTAVRGQVCRENAECHMSAHCVQDEQSRLYMCECLPGFRGDGVTQCVVADECNPRASETCDENARCQYKESERAYVCECNPGLVGDGKQCRHPDVPDPDADRQPAHPDRPRPVDPNQPQPSDPRPQEPHQPEPPRVRPQEPYQPPTRPDHQPSIPAQTRNATLLFAQGMAVFRRSTVADNVGKQLSLVPRQIVVGLDYDCAEGDVYWTDITGHVIRKASYLDPTNITTVITEGLESPEGLAIDWSSRLVYYSDSGSDEISVASLEDPGMRRVILSKDLVNPRALVLDISRGQLYYSDWNREGPVIGRASMDGSSQEIFISTEIKLPNGMVVLHARQQLCWVDAGTHRLECIGLSGAGRRVVHAPLSYPFGLTVLEELIFYWTDWEDKRIHSVSINGAGYSSFPASIGGAGKLYGITVLPEACPNMRPTACALNNGGCPQLCLPVGSTHSCACAGTHCEPESATAAVIAT